MAVNAVVLAAHEAHTKQRTRGVGERPAAFTVERLPSIGLPYVQTPALVHDRPAGLNGNPPEQGLRLTGRATAGDGGKRRRRQFVEGAKGERLKHRAARIEAKQSKIGFGVPCDQTDGRFGKAMRWERIVIEGKGLDGDGLGVIEGMRGGQDIGLSAICCPGNDDTAANGREVFGLLGDNANGGSEQHGPRVGRIGDGRRKASNYDEWNDGQGTNHGGNQPNRRKCDGSLCVHWINLALEFMQR